MRNVIAALVLFVATTQASAQQYFSPDRTASVVQTRATVGTTTAAAISPSSVAGSLLSFSVCNDAVNTSTYLLVGQAVDVSTDGVMLGLGQCFECVNCKSDVLKALKVEGQAASNGYTVIQYKK
jgi:hypothetical protein